MWPLSTLLRSRVDRTVEPESEDFSYIGGSGWSRAENTRAAPGRSLSPATGSTGFANRLCFLCCFLASLSPFDAAHLDARALSYQRDEISAEVRPEPSF